MNRYVEFRRNNNIRPVSIANKEEYYMDMINIEHSWSGRADTNIGNTFIMEAHQLLINAIELFELGYFDCAYYSLRSAVDISTTMVFLVDMPEKDRYEYISKWKDTKNFPMQRQMIDMLSNKGNIFIDMQRKMPEFFSSARELSNKLNKYVHKQGLQHFYLSRNNPIYQKESLDDFIRIFELYLKKCIGVVAIMRLAFDPFPILLMDEEILYRCFDSMTTPYSEDFVEKYIGKSILEKYKTTELYCGTYNSFIDDEKKNETVFNIMKHQYIDTKKSDDIFAQIHLLNKYDAIASLLALSCEKVVKVYCIDGIWMFFTDKNTNRKEQSWSGLDFKTFENSDDKINQKYDEAYISVFSLFGDSYFVEHNEPLEEEEVSLIESYVLENYKEHLND